MTDRRRMTNFLPTLSVTSQAIHPSLQAAALRMTGYEFNAFSAEVAHSVMAGNYAQLTLVLNGSGIEPLPEVVSQICVGRRAFLGKELPHNFVDVFARLPHTYGNEMIKYCFLERTWVGDDGTYILPSDRPAIAQDLVNLCGPYFHGNFSLLLDRLNELNTGPGDEAGPLSLNADTSSEELRRSLNLEPDWELLLSAIHCFPLVVTRDFSIRKLAHAVGRNIIPSMTGPEMRNIFCRGFHCADESIRLSFFRLTPALCADPSVEEGVKVACVIAVRNAVHDDPSPAIRQAAAAILSQLETPAMLR